MGISPRNGKTYEARGDDFAVGHFFRLQDATRDSSHKTEQIFLQSIIQSSGNLPQHPISSTFSSSDPCAIDPVISSRNCPHYFPLGEYSVRIRRSRSDPNQRENYIDSFAVKKTTTMEEDDVRSLLMAVNNDDYEVVKLILEDNPHIADDNTGDYRAENYCLHVACQRGFLEIAKLFVERGASLDRTVQIDYGKFSLYTDAPVYVTPLHLASKFGFPETVSFLLQKGAKVDTRILDSHSGETMENALELACHCAILDEDLPLELERDRDHFEVARLLLEAGATVTEYLIRMICNPEYLDGNLEMAQILFQHKSKAPCRWGVSHLHVACTFGCMMAALPLLQGNVDIDTKTCCGKTPLHCACEFGYTPIVQVLLNKGAKLETRDKQKWTALHWASGKGHTEIAEILLDQGANIEAEQRHGWTPLQLACQNDQLQTVRFLVDRGANIHTYSRTNGWTPLHTACRFGCLKLVRFLLDQGSNLHAKNAKGWSPFHLACRYGRLKIVRLLLDRGADLAMKIKGRMTPEQLARKYGQIEIAAFLASLD